MASWSGACAAKRAGMQLFLVMLATLQISGVNAKSGKSGDQQERVLQQRVLQQRVALKNVNVIDVKSLQLREKRTLLLDDGFITDIRDTGKKRIPKQYTVVDLKGKFLLPGLIDSHVHLATNPDGNDSLNENISRLRHLLRGGVTGVRDMGGDTRLLGYLKREALLDKIQAPDIYYSIIIGGEEFFSDPRTQSSARGYHSGNTSWMRAIDSNSDWKQVVAEAKGLGATGIKIYRNVSADLLSPLITQAKHQGLKVWSHAYIQPARPMDAVNAGAEVLSHANIVAAHVVENYKEQRHKLDTQGPAFKAENYRGLYQQMVKNGVLLDSTLTVYKTLTARDERFNKDYLSAVFNSRQALNAGVKIVAGTDSFADYKNGDLPSLHNEMALMVRDLNMKPVQAIQAATLHSAQALGMETRMGSIEKGKLANFVVTDKNPMENIEHTKSIVHVLKNGKFIYRGSDERLPFSAARASGNQLFLSGQIGNIPGTMVLNGRSIESQMHQTMHNIKDVLQEHNLGFNQVVKCTLMLENIKDWEKASEVYKSYFPQELPARSAFAADGLALGAKAEVECIADL